MKYWLLHDNLNFMKSSFSFSGEFLKFIFFYFKSNSAKTTVRKKLFEIMNILHWQSSFMASVKENLIVKIQWKNFAKTNRDERDLAKFNGIICSVAHILCVCRRGKRGKLNCWDKNRTIQFKFACNEMIKMKMKHGTFLQMKGKTIETLHIVDHSVASE